MQSPLSRYRTPTWPRSLSRFFRVRPSSESPRSLNHPVYFGLATVSNRQPFRPSTRGILPLNQKLSTPVVGAMTEIFRGLCTSVLASYPQSFHQLRVNRRSLSAQLLLKSAMNGCTPKQRGSRGRALGITRIGDTHGRHSLQRGPRGIQERIHLCRTARQQRQCQQGGFPSRVTPQHSHPPVF